MKIIDKLVIKSFIGPYIMSFFVAEFVLIMQFLWKYIDDILGKGFSLLEIIELIFYYGVTIIPMALPISILIASVMVFGDMAEKHELPTLKSAGVPLTRIMKGGFILALITFFFSIFASNYLKPTASFQFKKRFDIIRKQKSTLTIEEKIFNDDFNNFIIRVNEKNDDGRQMKDVLIYDHTKPDKSLINLISSDSAEMYSTEDGHYFIMNLYDGYQYQEDNREKKKDGGTKYPFMKTYFESYKKILDMGEFYLEEGDLSINRKREDMLNTFQIIEVLDSLENKKGKALVNLNFDYDNILKEKQKVDFKEVVKTQTIRDSIKIKLDSIQNIQDKPPHKDLRRNINRRQFEEINKVPLDLKALDTTQSFYELIDSSARYNVVNRAVSISSSRYDVSASSFNRLRNIGKSRQAYLLRLNQQYSFAFICLIFFFIGAPLGSIIRKGGYGYSLLVAILFYMVFIISSIVGEKLLKSDSLDGITGAWLPVYLLLPFSVLFTKQALNDVKFDLASKLSSIFEILRMKKKESKTNIS